MRLSKYYDKPPGTTVQVQRVPQKCLSGDGGTVAKVEYPRGFGACDKCGMLQKLVGKQ